jgi:Response regulators consisting of a CheY-like receiver domain and a winged-helix DNA-binding domain
MKILVVDDEKSIINLIRMNLELEGYEVVTSETGMDAIRKFTEEKPELVILDIMLPDISGHKVIRKLHELDPAAAVIMLTAKGEVNDKLFGLQLGADDYMTKPFNSEELLLRIKAISKRLYPVEEKVAAAETELVFAKIRIRREERAVWIDDRRIDVTYREFDMLLLMLENRNKVFTREKLLESVWRYAYEGNTRAVDMLIQRLRKKLGLYAENLKTVYGIGYKFEG